MKRFYFIINLSFIVSSVLMGHGFSARTIVHRASGSCMDIKRLCRSKHCKKARITTYNPYYGIGQHKIKRSGHSKTEQFICFGFDDNSCDIVCTPLQEFFIFSTQQWRKDCPSTLSATTRHRAIAPLRDGGWIPAYKLKKGDLLFCKDGPKPIKHINYVKKTIDVYSIELSDVHTFFVGYYGALTHNMDFPPVWGIGTSIFCGAGSGGSSGSFFGPISFAVGIALGAFIGLCVGLIQNKFSRKYLCDNLPLHFFDEYEQNNALSSVSSSGGGSLSPMPDGPKKNDEEDKNRIKISEKDKHHIFRKAEGHFPEDTLEARRLIEDMVNDANNFNGFDKFGNKVYSKNLSDGSQVWAKIRNGLIRWGGKNKIPWHYKLGVDFIRPFVKN